MSGTPQVGKKLKTTHGKWSATQPRLPLPVAGQRHADRRRDHQVVQARRAASSASACAPRSPPPSPARTPARRTSPPTDSASPRASSSTRPRPTVTGTPQVGVPLSATTGDLDPGRRPSHTSGTPAARRSTAPPTRRSPRPPTELGQADQGPGRRQRCAGYTTHARRVSTSARPRRAGPVHRPARRRRSPASPQVDQVAHRRARAPGPRPARCTYQWLADGKPIDGATGTAYTPTPGRPPHRSSPSRSPRPRPGTTTPSRPRPPRPPVAPGTFLNTREPAVVGTAQVGVPLTADHGHVDAQGDDRLPVGRRRPDGPRRDRRARSRRDRRTSASRSRVEVLASATGLPDRAGPSAEPPPPRCPGVIRSTQAPVVTGQRRRRPTLRTTNGSWSLTPDACLPVVRRPTRSRRHRARRTSRPRPRPGTGSTWSSTATAAGYTPLTAPSANTDRVVLGRVTFDKPTTGARRVVGHTLTAHVASFSADTPTPHYRWFRGCDADPRRPRGDVRRPAGRRRPPVHVEVTLQATNWMPVTRRSVAITTSAPCPPCTCARRCGTGRVFLRLTVRSPGIGVPERHGTRLARHRLGGASQVVDGHGSKLLRADARGHARAHGRLPRRHRGEGRPDHRAGQRPVTPATAPRTSGRRPAAARVRASPIA